MGWDGFIRPWSLTVALGSVNHAEEQGGVTAELDERRDLHWRNHLARDLRAGSTTRTEEDAPRARKTLETQKLTRVGACAVSSQKAPEPPPGGRRENGARTRSRRGDVTRRAARDWLCMRSGPGGTCLFPRAGATLPGTDVFGPG